MIDQILHHEAPPLGQAWADCPPVLAEIIHRCLEKETAKRYEGFSEVGSALRHFVRLRFAVEPHEPPFPRMANVEKSPVSPGKRSLVDRARELIHDEELELALLVLRTALRRDPLAPQGASLLLQVEKDLKAAARGAQAKAEGRDRSAEERTRPLPLPPPRERELATLLARAEALYREKKLGETRSILLEAIRLDPNHAEARELLNKTKQEELEREKEKRREESLAEAKELISKLCRKADVQQASEALSFAVRRLGPDSRILPEARSLARAASQDRAKTEDRREGLIKRGLALAQVLLDAHDFETVSRLLAALRPLDQEPAVIAPRLKELEKVRSRHAGQRSRKLQAGDAVTTLRGLIARESWHEAVDALAFAVDVFGMVPEIAKMRHELLEAITRMAASLQGTSRSLVEQALSTLAALPPHREKTLGPRLRRWIRILDPSAALPGPKTGKIPGDSGPGGLEGLLQMAQELARTGNRQAALSAVRALLAVDAGHDGGNTLLKELKSKR